MTSVEGWYVSLHTEISRPVTAAISQGQTPGAVVLLGVGDRVVYHEAFGERMVAPERRPMERDTVFDLASLTKPLATAPAILWLVERGEVLLGDPVSRYLSAFTGDGRDAVTIRHLLTHTAGLPPYRNYLTEWGESVPREERRARVVADICALPLQRAPGEAFEYTCLGYILLASVVQVASGLPLDRFAAERIYEPLGMSATCFNPPPDRVARCAATEQLPEGVLCGVVHDEDARFLSGVGGNAGLFSTAGDLARFMAALARGGPGTPFSAAAVSLMLTAQTDLPGGVRSLGWDVDTDYSPQVRGELFFRAGVGHSGYTGTSIWLDPPSGAFVILLTNRVHLGREQDISRLRRQVANVAAAHLLPGPARRLAVLPSPEGRRAGGQAPAAVLAGLDALAARGFDLLRGKRVGLITNHTGIDRDRRHILDLMLGEVSSPARSPVVAALFSPEHGFSGDRDERVVSGAHPSGLPIHSLYGEYQQPQPEWLDGLDALVYDIADVGVRFYTYTTTMALCMKAAAQAGVDFIVLDRPNPINGVTVEGPVLDAPFAHLAAWHPIPLRHGLTSGELALWSNAEYGLGCNLTVLPCEGWRRDMWFDDTGLPWVNPSPNMRNLKQAILYPCVGALETTNLSVGRGTDTPFEVFGAPWMDGTRLAQRLNEAGIAELSFVPIQFTPATREFAGDRCEGVYLMLRDREQLRPVQAAVQIALALRELWPEAWEYRKLRHLFASEASLEGIEAVRSVGEIMEGWRAGEEAFRDRRAKHLLYE